MDFQLNQMHCHLLKFTFKFSCIGKGTIQTIYKDRRNSNALSRNQILCLTDVECRAWCQIVTLVKIERKNVSKGKLQLHVNRIFIRPDSFGRIFSGNESTFEDLIKYFLCSCPSGVVVERII